MYAIKIVQEKQGVNGVLQRQPLTAAFEIKAVLKHSSSKNLIAYISFNQVKR